jgi:hypothetical protein
MLKTITKTLKIKLANTAKPSSRGSLVILLVFHLCLEFSPDPDSHREGTSNSSRQAYKSSAHAPKNTDNDNAIDQDLLLENEQTIEDVLNNKVDIKHNGKNKAQETLQELLRSLHAMTLLFKTSSIVCSFSRSRS